MKAILTTQENSVIFTRNTRDLRGLAVACYCGKIIAVSWLIYTCFHELTHLENFSVFVTETQMTSNLQEEHISIISVL